MTDYEALNQRFAIDERALLVPGPGDRPVLSIQGEHSKACISLHGAHVIDFSPRNGHPVLWLSRQAEFTPGKAIRGGIPLCWPWFGPQPADATKPAHGFARNRNWQLEHSTELDDGVIECRFTLAADHETTTLWPHSFELRYTIRVGQYLDCELHMINHADTAVSCTGALHTYLAVSDAEDIRIRGLDKRPYIDQVDGGRKKQQGPLVIDGEVDRIYHDTDDIVYLDDPGWSRTLVVAKSGSRSTVIWNPWIDKAARLSDFSDDEYHGMCCLEAANAGPDVVNLEPGMGHKLRCLIGTEPFGFTIDDLR